MILKKNKSVKLVDEAEDNDEHTTQNSYFWPVVSAILLVLNGKEQVEIINDFYNIQSTSDIRDPPGPA